ncbi:MAG TPA: hypothetical protein VMF52_18470 [Steroidobacteraceae bacterium]|nr:hypothetical protein [Steroidobacteraceae bacterium]
MRHALSLLAFATVLVTTMASASNYRDVTRAVTDDQMLQSAGVAPNDARIRTQCKAAVVDTDDAPEFFNCVYVQTDKSLNLFSVEDGFLMSELQLSLPNIDAVALQHTGRWNQIQLWSGHRVAVLTLQGDGFTDPKQNDAAYQWLIEHGVRQRDPVKWIGP